MIRVSPPNADFIPGIPFSENLGMGGVELGAVGDGGWSLSDIFIIIDCQFDMDGMALGAMTDNLFYF